MAIAATTTWEIRSSATAGNVNGGGFNSANTGNSGGPGTDYSQQDTAHANGTDLASTSASSWLVITSGSYTFLASDCGNIIHINNTGTGAHFTAGAYEIVSVSAGAATLDRACGSGSNASGATWHLGGGWSMNDSSDGTTFLFGVSGNSYWVKAGTYTFGGNWNLQGTGTAAALMNFIGYQTTRGDNPTGANRPLLKLNGNLILWGTAYWNIANLSTIGTSTNDTYGAFGAVGGNCRIFNCKAVNQSNGNHNAMFVGTNTLITGCEMVAYGGSGLSIGTNSNLDISNCYFHDSVQGILQNYGGGAVEINIQGCTFENCTAACINIMQATAVGPYLVQNCTFYGGETTKIGIGIYMQQTVPAELTALNNIFYGLATGINVINTVSPNTNIENYNTFNNCTTARTNIGVGTNSITLSPGFTSVGQYTGTTATSSGTTLTDSGANFANVVPGRDFVYVSASTGGNTGIFGITNNSSTTLTTDNSLGTGSAITYSVIWGHNFGVGTNMKGIGYANTGNINQTSYIDLGAVQRQAPVPNASDLRIGVVVDTVTGTYTGSDLWSDPGNQNVRLGINYQANSLTNNKTGRITMPVANQVKAGVMFETDAATTGTFAASCDYPVVNNVKIGIVYDNGLMTGTYNPLGVGSGISPAAQLSERTRKLILALIQTNISLELSNIRADRNDPSVNTEPPPSQSYFIYAEAHDYQLPAIFCIVDSGDIEDQKDGKNYVSANMKVFVSAVVGGQTQGTTTIRCDRYQAALFRILHQTVIVDTTDNVKIHVYVKRMQFGTLYSVSRKKDNMSDFRKEVALELEVQHWENPTS